MQNAECDCASEPLVLLWLQSLSLGLGEQWEQVKAAYAQANRALGDIVKVSGALLLLAPHPSYLMNKVLGACDSLYSGRAT